MKYSIMGYVVKNAEQARAILVVAKLRGLDAVAEQCRSVIKKYESNQPC